MGVEIVADWKETQRWIRKPEKKIIATSRACSAELCSKLRETQTFFFTEKENLTEATLQDLPQNHLNDLD